MLYSDSTRTGYIREGLKEFLEEFGLGPTRSDPTSTIDSGKMAELVLQVRELMPDLADNFIMVK